MKKERIMISFLSIVSLSMIQFTQGEIWLGDEYNNSLKINLIHRHSPQLDHQEGKQIPKTQLERLKDLLETNIRRQKMIAQVRAQHATKPARKRRKTMSMEDVRASKQPKKNPNHIDNSNNIIRNINDNDNDVHKSNEHEDEDVEMPIYAGRDFGTGQYFMEMQLGTPTKKFTMVVDSGTDLTWVHCLYKCNDRHCKHKNRKHWRGVFKADQSSSFKKITCSSSMCKVDLSELSSLVACPTPTSPCAYNFRYVDGSHSLGIFGNETITLPLSNGKRATMENMLIGCSDNFKGESFVNAQGVLGLGYSRFAFTTKATANFGGKFSYCLVDHLSGRHTSNFILFGQNLINKAPLSGYKRFTRLELGLIMPYYAVHVRGISVGKKMLDLPLEIWDVNHGGGTIIDSGTSLSVLVEPAFTCVMKILKKSVSRFERVSMEGLSALYCFNASKEFDKTKIPRLTYHFADGARFQPHSKSYIIDAADEVKCLGFQSVPMPGTNVIGNILQQNYLWEFDTLNSKLAYAPSTCT